MPAHFRSDVETHQHRRSSRTERCRNNPHSVLNETSIANLYVTASENGAPLAAELARGDGRPRVYRVEPTGPIEDDPNVTDKRFPGNPTRSYRTTEPLRVVEEVLGWDPPQADLVARIRANTGQLSSLGIEAMD